MSIFLFECFECFPGGNDLFRVPAWFGDHFSQVIHDHSLVGCLQGKKSLADAFGVAGEDRIPGFFEK